MDAPEPVTEGSSMIDSFWRVARMRAKLNPTGYYTGERPLASLRPPAWAFGATPEQADELLALVLSGSKTATSGALWDYEADGEALPTPGALGIVTDGRGVPHALIVTTQVEVVPFDEVSAEHAYLEGEGDRSLATWRDVHERFFTEHAVHSRGFRPDMPVVLQRFAVLYSQGSADVGS
ncbi:MAG TPA: ASCH domain-containing protein [Intrasporangium sp.]|uniref:ASCH domain-containing protein n=1 Tax=Intrasporangium sp. TaxID=1925024 RepID=UPI002B493CC0|nr:ASCH domain-containing protein [Intrasporangium sp.]HKX66290.1 ASCH domain-containing protein [Intrasporangium sp.]